MSFIDLVFGTGERRALSGLVGRAITFFAAAVAVYAAYAATFSRLDTLAISIFFVAMMLILVFLTTGASPNAGGDRVPWFDWALAAIAVVCGAYFSTQTAEIAKHIALFDELAPEEMLFSGLTVLLVLEATRRTVGLGLMALTFAFIAYNLWGHAIPGALGHGDISLSHFLDIMMFTADGVYGVAIRVAATYAFMFVIFGTFLERAGGSEFFFNLAALVTGRSPGGPAKVAVFSSAMFGTISGSPTSDVVTTGSVTIPMMRRMGYSPALAGGVEVAASTGGGILPPVMGSATFIMAEYTGIDYVEIAIAATIPCLLFFLGVYAQVHLLSLRMGLRGMSRAEIPGVRHTMRQGWLFLAPLVVICWLLGVGYAPTFVALFAALSVIAVSWLRRETRLTPAMIYECLATSTIRMVAVTGACAAAGLVIGGISMTGLAAKFSHLVFYIAGSDVFSALIVAALLSVLLGMGMPTPNVYILAAVLTGPLLVKELGVEIMAAHLFLLYYASMSAMTPPVAVAAYAASAITQSNPFAIGLVACRLSFGAFLVPFSFAYEQSLLMRGPIEGIVFYTVSASIGILLLSVAAEGYTRRVISWWERIAIGAGGLTFLAPSLRYTIAGAVVAALGLARSYLGRWRAR